MWIDQYALKKGDLTRYTRANVHDNAEGGMKMNKSITDFQYPEKGVRKIIDENEARLFTRVSLSEGGTKRIPAAASAFARNFSSGISGYSKPSELPNWLKALATKKVSMAELAKAVHDRLNRAPTRENMELALNLANEIARLKGGGEILSSYVTPELLARLSGEGGKAK